MVEVLGRLAWISSLRMQNTAPMGPEPVEKEMTRAATAVGVPPQ